MIQVDRWNPAHHRSITTDPTGSGAVQGELPGGMPVMVWHQVGATVRLDGQVPNDYAGQSVTVEFTWTCPTGAVGNLNIGIQWRRLIDGANPLVPEGVLLGPGAQAAPTGYIPKRASVIFTNAQTGPIFPAFGGIVAGDRYRLYLTVAGGTTLSTVAYLIGCDVYVP